MTQMRGMLRLRVVGVWDRGAVQCVVPPLVGDPALTPVLL